MRRLPKRLPAICLAVFFLSLTSTLALAQAQEDDAAVAAPQTQPQTQADATSDEADAEQIALQSNERHSSSTIDNELTAFHNHRVTSSPTGAIGLLRTDSAILGESGLTRLSLTGFFAKQDGFPTRAMDATHTGARLAADLVFLNYFEAYFSYGIDSNFADLAETSRQLQTIGDLQFGLKGSSQIFDGLYLGGSLNFGLTPGFGTDTTSGMGFEFAPRLIASWDVRSLHADVPLLLHLNLGAIFSNHDRVYDAFAPDAFDEFAFGLNRYNRLSVALGAEIPLPWVTPFLEWNMALPITSSDLHAHDGDVVSMGSAMEHRMSVGLKVTALPDITFLLAVDVGLTGEAVQGIAPTPNVAFTFGLSYAFDPLLPHRAQLSAAAAVEDDELPPLPPSTSEPSLASDEATTAPAPVAATPIVATDAPVEAPASAVVPAIAPPPSPRPRLFLQGSDASVAGQVTLLDGGDGGATFAVTADQGIELTLKPGTYKVRVQADGFLTRIDSLTIAPGRTRFELTLTPRPATELLESGSAKAVVPAAALFLAESADLAASSAALLDQMADLLLSGKAARLRIEGHTDNRGNADQKLTLSKSQASAIREALMARGIEGERLLVEGKGGGQPIASNALSRGRVRNRRIELHVLADK
ncbi:MAG: OmpA family protein [Myxococcales bacterium]|jgi:outer membrane protein OmpA-like peptidoglycan-associated protein|nr:OmpA family protein [Myxococcales bacterium]